MITELQKKFLENYDYKNNLIIIGSVGVGKTYEAEKLLNKFQDLKYKVTDTRFKEYVGGSNLRLRNHDEWQCGIHLFPLEMMIRSKLLLFDDLGVSDITDAYLRKLTFVLDERIEKNLPIIFTTNLSPDELESKLDKRIKSRIFLNSNILQIIGKDRRQTNINVIK